MFKNIQLAEDRVNAVKEYITKDGLISVSRIAIKSWGPYKPVVINSTEEARKKNQKMYKTLGVVVGLVFVIILI